MYAYDHANVLTPLSLIMLKAARLPPKCAFYMKFFFSFFSVIVEIFFSVVRF